MRAPQRYRGRYVLDGRPHVFDVWAWNRTDAAAAVERLAREALGAKFSSALSYGVERAGA